MSEANLNGPINDNSPVASKKAMVLALGKAFPDNVLLQENLVDGFLHDTKSEDPVMREKLERLCKFNKYALV
jgi:Chalcone and stilbene synthases, N-terminal domain